MCLVLVLTVAIAFSGCKYMYISTKAESVFRYMIYFRYIQGETRDKDQILVRLKLMEGTIKVTEPITVRVYLFDTFIKDNDPLNGSWQMKTDVRKSGLVKVLTTVYNGTDMDAFADVTDIYRNTNAFEKQDASVVESEKTFYYDEEKGYVLRFVGDSLLEHALAFAINDSFGEDPESLYQYLEKYTEYPGGACVRYTYGSFSLPILAVAGRYRINDGEWVYVEGGSCDFVLADYNRGDVIWYQAIYANGELSAPVSHTISSLTVSVDPDGGNINGNTDIYKKDNVGAKDNRVSVATEREEAEGFVSEVCSRGEETLEGFEFTDGDGTIVKEPSYQYRIEFEMINHYSGTRKKGKVKVDASMVEQFDNEEDFKVYYANYMTDVLGGKIEYLADTIVLYRQNGYKYYVEPGLENVSVRAIWSGSKRTEHIPYKYTLVKAGSNMYGKFMARRTDGDTDWIEASFKASKTTDSAELKAMSEYHTTILPNGEQM